MTNHLVSGRDSQVLYTYSVLAPWLDGVRTRDAIDRVVLGNKASVIDRIWNQKFVILWNSEFKLQCRHRNETLNLFVFQRSGMEGVTYYLFLLLLITSYLLLLACCLFLMASGQRNTTCICRQGQVIATPALYSWVPSFSCRPGFRLSWL